MKALLFVILYFIPVAFGAEAMKQPSKFDAFVSEYYWLLGGLILLFEYLVGRSKLKSNSTLDLLLSGIKKLDPKKK